MSSINNFDYILRDTDLKRIYLSNNILFMEIFKSDDSVQNDIILKGVKNFSATIDNSGKNHIVIIDELDNLVHLYNINNTWQQKRIENINFKSYTVKDLKIYTSPLNTIHVLCLLGNHLNSNNWRVKHYIIERKHWNSSTIANIYNKKYDSTIRSDLDRNGNIHLIYKTKKDNFYNLYYQIYDIEFKKWSSPKRLDINPEIGNIEILCASNNSINIIWSSLRNKNIMLNYLSKQNNSKLVSKWKKSKTLSRDICNFNSPVLFQCNEYIKLIWRQNKKIYLTQRSIYHDNWTDPTMIYDNFNYILTPLSYIGSSYKDFKYIHLPYAYYCFNKNLFLVGLDEFSDKKPSLDSLSDLFKPDNNLSNYLIEASEHIKHSFIIENLFPKSKKKTNINDIELTNLDDFNMKSFTNKLVDLYYELEDLKNQELIIFSSLSKIRNQHSKLYKQMEDILNEYNKFSNS